jgi:CO dehydrogenase nickel-insertion accessory protein CooC1
MNMTEKVKTLAGKKIGVFGKGGSGKSTAVVLLAKALKEQGYEVCILDADSTNIGLDRALGLDKSPASLIDYFGGMIFSGGAVTCPVDDPTQLSGAEISVDALPRRYYGQNQAGILFLKAGKIGDRGPGAGCDGPISKIARDFKLSQNGDQPVTLIDFKAGFEDSARGAVTSLDWVMVIVDPTTAAMEMAVNMTDMVNRIKAGELPATRHLESPELVQIANLLFTQAKVKGVLVVLNKVKDDETESFMTARLAEQGIKPIGVIHEDPSIAMSWLKGTSLNGAKTEKDTEKIIEELEEAEEAYPAGQL